MQRGFNFNVDRLIKSINALVLKIFEKADSQNTLNTLVFILNHYVSLEPIPKKMINLVIKCLSKMSAKELIGITDEGTVEFLIGCDRYFKIVHFD